MPSPEFSEVLQRYGLELGDGGRSVILRTSRPLSQKDAFKKFSIVLALLGIYEGVGLIERAGDGLEGFSSRPSREEYDEPSYPEHVSATIRQLEKANDPYQIQACFTLSRGLAHVTDPESAIIEFFRVIELYIKHLAWTEALNPEAANNVLVYKLILSKRVKDALKTRRILRAETVDLIYKLKEVRNKFLSHGGIRPTLSELFGDPEKNGEVLESAEFRYDPDLHYGPGFYERVLNDVSLLSGFIFSKLQGTDRVAFVRQGAWVQGSPQVHDVLAAEHVRWIGPGASQIPD